MSVPDRLKTKIPGKMPGIFYKYFLTSNTDGI